MKKIIADDSFTPRGYSGRLCVSAPRMLGLIFFCWTVSILYSQNLNLNLKQNMINITQFKDSDNRVFVPQGFVANTHFGKEKMNYLPVDYKQMQRYGANFQVIRVEIGRLGGWPGVKLDPDYLTQIDSMIKYGADAGIKSGIKLVVYDVKSLSKDVWDQLWKNKNNEQELLSDAWETLWKRYKNNSNVFCYDLLNEPKLGNVENTSVLEKNILAPLYRKLIDKLHTIDTNKWACFQPIHTEPTNEVFCPFAPWQTPLERNKIIYAPHIYDGRINIIPKRLDTYLREADLSNAKLMLGEWGPPTRRDWDSNFDSQNLCKKVYETTCNEVDARSIGTVKAWFCGTIRWYGKEKNATWAIFEDEKTFGTKERKYIMDFLCRTRPLAVAGNLKKFGFDFATRTLTMNYIPQSNSVPTEIYVPVNRHYPDGFRLKIDNKEIFELQVSPDSPTGLLPKLIDSNRKIEWQPWAQRLLIYETAKESKQKKLEITPGFCRDARTCI